MCYGLFVEITHFTIGLYWRNFHKINGDGNGYNSRMRRSRRRIVYLIILGLGLIWIYISAEKSDNSSSERAAAPQAGFLAPDFELPATSGEMIRLSNLRGQAVLVNLWATWCPPCREEMPSIEKVYNEYKDQGFVVLA